MTDIVSIAINPEIISLLQAQDLADPYEEEVIEEHAAEPIKDRETIQRIIKYFLENNQLRNCALFVTGINAGLRISDLLKLRFQDIFNEDGSRKEYILLKEKKTKKKRGFALSDKTYEILEMYRQSIENYRPELYLFRSESRIYNNTNDNKPMTRQGVHTVFDRTWKDLGLTTRHGTHMLRKTFAYQILTGTKDPLERTRRLETLMKMFNHSNVRITLAYAGITREEEVGLYRGFDYGT